MNDDDHVSLELYVRRIVNRVRGETAKIQSIERRAVAGVSSYASEFIDVTIFAEQGMTLFLKNFSRVTLPKESLRDRRQRELFVYRDLLSDANLGTAILYDFCWSDPEKRFWLFLESVPGTPVRYCNFEQWVAAARWLARMHAHFAPQLDRLRTSRCLLRQDEAFFHNTAERALERMRDTHVERTAELTTIVRRYCTLVARISEHPQTLLHGAFKPEQVLTDRAGRICPVDWELAGIGSGFYDLAFLSDGFRSRQRRQLFQAYCEQATACGLAVPDLSKIGQMVDCYRMHRLFSWISRSQDRAYPASKVAELCDSVEAVSSELFPSGESVRK